MEVTNLGFFASHILEEDIFQILKKMQEIKKLINPQLSEETFK